MEMNKKELLFVSIIKNKENKTLTTDLYCKDTDTYQCSGFGILRYLPHKKKDAHYSTWKEVPAQ